MDASKSYRSDLYYYAVAIKFSDPGLLIKLFDEIGQFLHPCFYLFVFQKKCISALIREMISAGWGTDVTLEEIADKMYEIHDEFLRRVWKPEIVSVRDMSLSLTLYIAENIADYGNDYLKLFDTAFDECIDYGRQSTDPYVKMARVCFEDYFL